MDGLYRLIGRAQDYGVILVVLLSGVAEWYSGLKLGEDTRDQGVCSHPAGALRTLRCRTHGQVINAHAVAPRMSSESRYQGHGPSTSSNDLASGLVLRKP